MTFLGASRAVLWPGTRRDVHTYTLETAPGPPWGPVTVPGSLRVCWGPPPCCFLSGPGALQVLLGPFLTALPAVHVDCALGGRRAGPRPCIIPGLNGAAARVGRVQAQLTLQPSGLVGQALSFLPCPLWPGSEEGMGAGRAERPLLVGGGVRPSSLHSCNFYFGLGG